MVTNAITDKKAAIAAIQRGQCTLQNLDHSLWKDREVVLAAVQQDGIAL